MKQLVFLAALLVFSSCGESEEEVEGLELDSFEDKLAYTLGTTSARDLFGSESFDASRLEKELVFAGFKENFENIEPTCGPSIEGLLGPAGTDFNTTFLNDGSECIGRFISFSLYSRLDGFEKAQGIDTTILFQGFYDAMMETDTSCLSMEDQDLINKEFSEGIKVLIDQKMEEQWKGNRIAGENFLAENKLKEGVMTTATGLQYEVLKKGSGPMPTTMNSVKVHYHGTTMDGNVFDSSVDRGEPISFQVTGVIPGWTEALQLMPQGSKYRLYIPQELAYGAYPQPGGPIQPFSMLIFDVELLEIQ